MERFHFKSALKIIAVVLVCFLLERQALEIIPKPLNQTNVIKSNK